MNAVLAEMSIAQLSLKEAVIRGGMNADAACAVFAAIQRYEDLGMALAICNAVLERDAAIPVGPVGTYRHKSLRPQY